jgi:hypothetical protein
MFLPINQLEDIQTVAGILVKNGLKVERAKVKKGKSFKYGIDVTGDGETKELDTEDEE